MDRTASEQTDDNTESWAQTDSQTARLHALNSRHYNVNVKAGRAKDYISLQAHTAAAEPVCEKTVVQLS